MQGHALVWAFWAQLHVFNEHRSGRLQRWCCASTAGVFLQVQASFGGHFRPFKFQHAGLIAHKQVIKQDAVENSLNNK